MTTEVTAQDFSTTAAAAINSPWAYIGVDAGIASVFVEQTEQIFKDAKLLANDVSAGLTTEAQRFQRASQLWSDLSAGLSSELDGMRARN